MSDDELAGIATMTQCCRGSLDAGGKALGSAFHLEMGGVGRINLDCEAMGITPYPAP